MSSRTITADDLTGKESLTTKKYVLTITPVDGKGKSTGDTVEAEFDLTADSATAVVKWFTDNDTRDLAGLLPRRIRIDGAVTDNSETATIRTWAKAQPQFKNTVKDRGALPEDVIDAYRKAHPKPAE